MLTLLGPKKQLLQRRKRRALLSVTGALALAGIYLIALVLSPVQVIEESRAPTAEAKTQKPITNSLVIPKINVDIEYKSGDAGVLNDYAWYRYPERGNPVEGGNMILSAHRFELGFTPGETRRKSPFYNIHRLRIGDKIVVYYEGEEYEYRVSERKTVSPVSLEIEAPTKSPVLTIYSCTFGGERDGREVILATPIKT